jgi:hypothetical protein
MEDLPLGNRRFRAMSEAERPEPIASAQAAPIAVTHQAERAPRRSMSRNSCMPMSRASAK